MAAIARAFVLRARAKFNVRLEVGAVRPGGLHELRSLVADLDIGDDIRFTPSERGFSVHCDALGLPENENLAYRAAVALGRPLPAVEIDIDKNIPARAGLGGGSADAAAVLRGLSAIAAEADSPLSPELVWAAATATGSDVAACLEPGLKIVSGSGADVRPLAFKPPPFGLLLLKPAVGVDTAQAYRLLDRSRAVAADLAKSHVQTDALSEALRIGDFAGTCALVHNDFQAVIEAAYPPVLDVRRRLSAVGAFAAVLCGSGSCVAGLFPNRVAAESARARITTASGEWAAVAAFADAG